MAWVWPIAVFTLATLTMEVQMELHVDFSVVMHAGAWDRDGSANPRS
jgi:hypothetical protein